MSIRAPAVAEVLLGAFATALSFACVWLVRLYSLRRGVLDQPSARSSHTVPTPRGGGLGLVIAVLLAGGGALAGSRVPALASGLAALAVIAVATIGWLDDHRPQPARARLLAHLLAGLLVAYLADRWMPWTGLGRAAMGLWWVFWTVSAINVVNFMDGIDGLIGSQMAIYGAYVALLAPASSAAALLGWSVAGASLGFLGLNWAPARIFLGDVGSGACGVIAVLLGLELVVPGELPSIVRAFLPLAPLFLDATVTLVRRARAGERLTTPHRRHLYQRLANGPWGHARTSLAYAGAAALGGVAGAIPGRAGLMVTVAYGAGIALVGRQLERLAPWGMTASAVTAVTDARRRAGQALP